MERETYYNARTVSAQHWWGDRNTWCPHEWTGLVSTEHHRFLDSEATTNIGDEVCGLQAKEYNIPDKYIEDTNDQR